MFNKILIANRGEIAVRIIRACRNLGIRSVAVYSKEDAKSLHVQLADQRICIGEGPARNSYLNMDRIIAAAENMGADAIHPGFGFLSENSEFVRKCKENGITFIGPPANVIAKLGNKQEARNTMISAGIPVIPGSDGSIKDLKQAILVCEDIGYPVLLKAAAGGGGKGIRLVNSFEELEKNYNIVKQEAKNSFNDDEIYIEKYIKDYEEGMPSGAMDKIVNQFTPDGIGKLLSDNSVKVNEFETNDTITSYFTDKLNDGTVSYKKKAGEYSEKTPVYVVYAGDTPIAKVELKSAGKNAHKFNKWTLGTVSFGDFTKNLAEVKITAPTGADVYINGVQVTDTYKTESEVKFAPCLHVSDYVTVPTNDVYDVGQLIAQPDITAKLNGKDLTVDYDKKTGYTIYYPSDDELYKSMESRIYTIAEQYGAYIINRGSLSKLSSYMVGTAAEYVSDIPAIWAYLWGKSYTYQFNNESITNFRKYSDKCFSCDVYYDLYVDYKTGNTTYKTSLTYTFVKQNGTWMLADFLIN